ncbi:MAG: hypothetical protein QXQ91_04655 [Nanopusillaceae archaeon]
MSDIVSKIQQNINEILQFIQICENVKMAIRQMLRDVGMERMDAEKLIAQAIAQSLIKGQNIQISSEEAEKILEKVKKLSV